MERRVQTRWAKDVLAVCGWLVWMSVWGNTGWSQSAPVVYEGSWTASAGGDQYLRGTWSGQISGANPNAGQGSWTLVSDAGDMVMNGTWSARKTARTWEGTWTAKVAGGGTLSGSWSADLKVSDGKLEEMLARTMQKQVAGGWQSGRRQGFWWLEGASRKKKR